MGFYMGNQQEAYDAEPFTALRRKKPHRPDRFTGSDGAYQPQDQGKTWRQTLLALYEWGNTLYITRVPSHRGITDNETADANAKDAAERKIPSKGSCIAVEGEEPPSLKEALPNGQHATGKDTGIRNQGKTILRLKPEMRLGPPSRPSLRPSLGAPVSYRVGRSASSSSRSFNPRVSLPECRGTGTP